jgi:hypothetical protein
MTRNPNTPGRARIRPRLPDAPFWRLLKAKVPSQYGENRDRPEVRHGFRAGQRMLSTLLLRSAGGTRDIRHHGGTNERLQRLFVDLVALVEINGAAGVALEAGVEKT